MNSSSSSSSSNNYDIARATYIKGVVLRLAVRITSREARAGGCQDGQGSGFFITPSGVILTCAHVIPQTESYEMEVFQELAKLGNAAVICKDEENDLALLYLKKNVFPPYLENPNGWKWKVLPFGSTLEMGEASVRDKITVVGYPGITSFVTFSQGILSCKSQLSGRIVIRGGEQIEYRRSLFRTDAAANPGNSGGPVLNADHVIGVFSALVTGEQNGTLFVPIEDVIKFIKANLPELGRISPVFGYECENLSGM